MAAVRLLAFTDCVYRQEGREIYTDRAFVSFLARVGQRFDQLTIVGRLDGAQGAWHYRLDPAIRFVPLPSYADLTHPAAVGRSLLRSLRRFWGALDDADCVWLLGPAPHAVAFALLARIRNRRLTLGVRQDWSAYVRGRRTQRWTHIAGDLLESCWRALSRGSPTVVVGPDLAANYRGAASLLEIAVSLVSTADVEAGAAAAQRSYGDDLILLSVGRLDPEKNPLLLAEAFARLRAEDSRWRLVVCGEGPVRPALEERLRELGVAEFAQLRGFVTIAGGLLEIYRSSHVFLHVSLTEGFPQVLLEAFASGLPTVATAVGGVADAAGDVALLIPPRNREAAVLAVQRLVADRALRERLVTDGLARARRQTNDREADRVARFIAGTDPVAQL